MLIVRVSVSRVDSVMFIIGGYFLMMVVIINKGGSSCYYVGENVCLIK